MTWKCSLNRKEIIKYRYHIYTDCLQQTVCVCLHLQARERERERERVVIKWIWENINGSISTLSTRRLELQLESNIYRLLPSIPFLWDFFSSLCQDLCPLTATMLHNLDPLNYNVMKQTELTLMFDKIYKHQTKHRKWFFCWFTDLLGFVYLTRFLNPSVNTCKMQIKFFKNYFICKL